MMFGNVNCGERLMLGMNVIGESPLCTGRFFSHLDEKIAVPIEITPFPIGMILNR